MGLETASFLSDLVASNPGGSDDVSQGDDHIRLLKTVLQATLPGASKAFYFPTTLAKSANFTVLSSHMNCTFVSTTSGGSFTYTLPTLASGDAGWEAHFMKIGTDTNPFFVAPASGTIQSGDQSGLAKVRRCIPGVKTTAFWTGSAWIMSRATNAILGAVIDTWRTSTPVGYEIANGATLSSASTNYPEFYQANGSSGVLPDATGRVIAGKEASATRLTSAGSGVDGATKGATGGAQNLSFAQANLPAITWPKTLAVGKGTLDVGGLGGGEVPRASSGGVLSLVNNVAIGGGNDGVPKNTTGGTPTVTGSPSLTGDTTSGGSGTPLQICQPTIVMPKLVVVE